VVSWAATMPEVKTFSSGPDGSQRFLASVFRLSLMSVNESFGDGPRQRVWRIG
jgi:hypothetical protein